MNMQAAILYQPSDLRVETIDFNDQIDTDEAIISISHTGICGSDLDRVLKTGTYSFPTIPGHEFSGRIEKIGNHETLAVGDPVVVAPMQPCFACEHCQQGNYGQCLNYKFMGSRNDGAFAQYLKVPLKNIIPFPKHVPLKYGALIEPAAVTLHGLNRIKITAGDTVAVLGCGTIGLFAIRLAKLLGATQIIAVDLAEEKLASAEKLGATILINSAKTNATEKINELTGGVQIAIETAGVPFTQVQTAEITRDHGKILLLGTAHKDVTFPAATFERIIRGEITLTGSWNSYSAPFPGQEWQTIIDFIGNGSLDMSEFITHTITLTDLPKTIQQMADREFSFNKVLVDLNS
ncbi:MAG: galactitol-1-phosphate 5-dehydrogenase [Enterococcus malodoratus]|uniref:galactitol-1-phosphate 5-dehydrogenase n=1 Tax=Enterococcus malodoratus TaxID=71451 RepID=UPI003FCFF7D2